MNAGNFGCTNMHTRFVRLTKAPCRTASNRQLHREGMLGWISYVHRRPVRGGHVQQSKALTASKLVSKRQTAKFSFFKRTTEVHRNRKLEVLDFFVCFCAISTRELLSHVHVDGVKEHYRNIALLPQRMQIQSSNFDACKKNAGFAASCLRRLRGGFDVTRWFPIHGSASHADVSTCSPETAAKQPAGGRRHT